MQLGSTDPDATAGDSVGTQQAARALWPGENSSQRPARQYLVEDRVG